MPLPIWSSFTARERRNIAFYATGIVLYKLGMEAYHGSIVAMAADRFGGNALGRLGLLTGLNQGTQVFGSILVTPLMKSFKTRSILAVTIVLFAFITSLPAIVDASTGGKIKANNGGIVKFGSWSPNVLYPIHGCVGVTHGIIELMRRVVPRDIVGGDVDKLRKMDAIVHILYMLAGTGGAFLSVVLLQTLGKNYALVATPPFFVLAAICWRSVDGLDHESKPTNRSLEGIQTAQPSYARAVLGALKTFCRATYRGAQICLTTRKFIWLPLAYSLAMYGHRYLEFGIAPALAKRLLKESSYSQIIHTGSNAGELIGALVVLIVGRRVPTPIPYIRLDALTLMVIWALPTLARRATPHQASWAWTFAGVYIPISIGFASGDVSLAAYIQSSLAKIESEDKDISALGAVMSFLFSTFVVVYTVASALFGRYVDRVYRQDGNIQRALLHLGCAQYTILAAIILAASLIPKGALSLNPPLLEEEAGCPDDAESLGDDVETLDKRTSSTESDEGKPGADGIELTGTPVKA